MKNLLLSIVLMLFASQVFAQYETVVQGTSFNSASKVVLDQEAIKKSKAPNVLSLLASQANLAISTSNLQPGSLFLRGGDSSHILILVDGLPFYDASTTQRTANLNNMDVKNIRRIEIIKGSQSVLYGGQALTGVIKIETLPLEMKNQANVVVEGGDYSYRKLSLTGFKALSESQGFLARGQMAQKKTRSPVLESEKTYWNHLKSYDLAHVYQGSFTSYIKVTQTTQKDNIVTTGAGGYAADASDFTANNDISGVSAGLIGKSWPLRPQLLVGYQDFSRSFLSLPADDYRYGSQLLAIRFEATPVDLESTTLKVGLSHNKENFIERTSGLETSNAFFESQGAFAKLDQVFHENVVLEAGVRADIAAHRDRVDSYQLGLTLFKDWKLEYATAFKAPSLFQMNSKTYGGSVDLLAEKARTYSLTYEKEIKGEEGEHRHFVSATAFETSFENLIAYAGVPPTGSYSNIAKTQTRGIEASYSLKKPQAYRIDFNMGYQEPWDITNVRWLQRRPLHNGSVRLTGEFEKNEAGFETVWTGDRADRFGGKDITLPGYIVTNVFFNHKFSDTTSGYFRGNNLENVRYESARSYHDEGTFWLAGMEISL